jgi:hypothetical protein
LIKSSGSTLNPVEISANINAGVSAGLFVRLRCFRDLLGIEQHQIPKRVSTCTNACASTCTHTRRHPAKGPGLKKPFSNQSMSINMTSNRKPMPFSSNPYFKPSIVPHRHLIDCASSMRYFRSWRDEGLKLLNPVRSSEMLTDH